jgi:hypothetical protein
MSVVQRIRELGKSHIGWYAAHVRLFGSG